MLSQEDEVEILTTLGGRMNDLNNLLQVLQQGTERSVSEALRKMKRLQRARIMDCLISARSEVSCVLCCICGGGGR